MRLIIQPGDGVESLIQGIERAKERIEVMIFRFDLPEIERALREAVERGIFVHVLIAFTNRGGEARLRKLERRLLSHGITVARTADDLIRYHGKMILVDRAELYLLGFNFTHLDINQSRSFGLITRNPYLVEEAVRLFEADCKRQNYSSKVRSFLVSPVNARRELTRFIQGARNELLIYDPKFSDPTMLKLVEELREAGVKVKIIGLVTRDELPARELHGLRLHTRTIIRDRRDAFLGSQSLRGVELDRRREIGLIFRDQSIIEQLVETFEEDWQASCRESLSEEFAGPPGPAAKEGIGLLDSMMRRIARTSIAKQVRKLLPKKPSRKSRSLRRTELDRDQSCQQIW